MHHHGRTNFSLLYIGRLSTVLQNFRGSFLQSRPVRAAQDANLRVTAGRMA